MGVAGAVRDPSEEGQVGTMLIANASNMALGLVFLALGMAIVLDTAILLWALDAADLRAAIPFGDVGVAIALIAFGSAHVRRAAMQWSARFNADTISLAGPLPHPVTTKDERKARARDYLRTLIRTGIKAPPMPGGLIGKCVLQAAPRLNLVQPPIRSHAYRQLRRGLYLGLVVFGLLVAWVVADPAVFPVMATLYFCVAIVVARPDDVFHRDLPEDPNDDIESPLPHAAPAIGLVALSVLAPTSLSYLASEGLVVLPDWLATLGGLAWPTLAIALPTIAGCALFFVALSKQSRDLREFDGSRWGSTQPYTLPEVSQGLVRHIYDRLPGSGTLLSWRFDRREEALYAGFLAEADARLDVGEEAGTLAEAATMAWNTPSSRTLLVLDGLALLLGLAACAFAWRATDDTGGGSIAMALALVAASQACMTGAHKLWKRADFVSLVYEADIEAVSLPPPPNQIHVGSPKGGRDLHLASGNVRVRVLRMRSVQFDPRGQRYVTGLELDIGESTRLATAVDDYHARVMRDGGPLPPDALSA